MSDDRWHRIGGETGCGVYHTVVDSIVHCLCPLSMVNAGGSNADVSRRLPMTADDWVGWLAGGLTDVVIVWPNLLLIPSWMELYCQNAFERLQMSPEAKTKQTHGGNNKQ